MAKVANYNELFVIIHSLKNLTCVPIMVTFFEASLDTISVHHVGNQSQSEMYSLSEQPLVLKDELINSLLKQYFLSPFEKVNEVYHLMHSSDLNLNEIYSFAT